MLDECMNEPLIVPIFLTGYSKCSAVLGDEPAFVFDRPTMREANIRNAEIRFQSACEGYYNEFGEFADNDPRKAIVIRSLPPYEP